MKEKTKCNVAVQTEPEVNDEEDDFEKKTDRFSHALAECQPIVQKKVHNLLSQLCDTHVLFYLYVE